MSEKSEQTKKKLLKNADKITIGILAVILVGLIYAVWQENSSAVASAEVNPKPAVFTDELAGGPTLNMLQNMSASPDINRDSAAVRVAQLSMFDLSTMTQEQQLEQQARAQLPAVQTLIEQGKTDEARQQLEKILAVVRYDRTALDLMDKVTTKPETTPAGVPQPDGSGMPGMQ